LPQDDKVPVVKSGAERIGATAQRRLNLIGKLNRWFSSRRTAAAGIVVLRQSRTLPERLSGDRSFVRGRREFKRKHEMTKSSAPTKADLHRMLAEAVRNTQPQPLDPQAEPARNDTPAAKRASPTRHTRTTQGRTDKTKRVRSSTRGKGKPRQR
jgi:hypothetical protein